jgi:hypothetical protein
VFEIGDRVGFIGEENQIDKAKTLIAGKGSGAINL